MCGIVGGVYWEAIPDKNQFAMAIAALHHRGPDEQGVFVKNYTALAHARLSIIDLLGGTQPLHSSDNTLHLIANGEIYNYLELDKTLKDKVPPGLSKSDSEAIIKVYQAHGPAGFNLLNGMFAFALYDEKKDTLVICRDRLGIKPLYFIETTKGLFFSSEIKGLLPLLDKIPEVNPHALASFQLTQYHSGRDTIFKDIKRVLPGEYLLIKNKKVEFYNYWTITDVATREITLNQALEEFESLFDTVMREHMRSDVPFGLFLSGGIDSSVLLAELSKLQSNQLKTYSIGFAGVQMEDELDAAGVLAKKFGTDHCALRVNRDELFERIVHSIWAADDLMRDYATLPTLLLSEVASRDLKVVFSGEGGDEVFAGYRRYAPSALRWLGYRVFGRGTRAPMQWHPEIRDVVFSEELKKYNISEATAKAWRNAPASWSLMKKRQLVDLTTALPDNLFVKADRMMMAFGLEGRVPFADHRIVEFGFSLPDKLKYQNGKGKWLIRQWAEKYLPQDHLLKPKRGFHVPVKEWLSGEYSKRLGQKLMANRAINEWFDMSGVEHTLKSHNHGKNYSRELWGLMQFAIWHTLFIDKPGVIPSKKESPLDWI